LFHRSTCFIDWKLKRTGNYSTKNSENKPMGFFQCITDTYLIKTYSLAAILSRPHPFICISLFYSSFLLIFLLICQSANSWGFQNFIYKTLSGIMYSAISLIYRSIKHCILVRKRIKQETSGDKFTYWVNKQSLSNRKRLY